MNNHKFSTSNLYDELDKIQNVKNKNNIKKNKIKIIKNNLFYKFYEIIKLLLIIALIISPFLIKHIYSAEIDDFFNNVEEKAYNIVDDSSSTTHKNESKIINKDNKLDVSIPEIYPTGIINKNSEKFIVFKYNNKIYTKTVGDKFADNTLEIVKITNSEVEIKDFNGNIFNFSIKNK